MRCSSCLWRRFSLVLRAPGHVLPSSLSCRLCPSPPFSSRTSPPPPGISAQHSSRHPIARLAPQCSVSRTCLRRSFPRFGPEAHHPPCSQRRRREAFTPTPDASEPAYLSPWSWQLSAYSKPQSSPRAYAPSSAETGALDDSGIEHTRNNRHQQWRTRRSPPCSHHPPSLP
jgi:hypothetical protein